MRKVLLLSIGLIFFGCESTTRNETTETTETNVNETNSDESVAEGSGSEISPQLEGIEDSAARLKVDTINSAQEAQKAN